MLSEYEIKARRWLEGHHIHFNAVEHGDRCPLSCDGKCHHGDRYRVTFTRRNGNGRGKRLSLDFWNSLADVQEGKHDVEPYEVLACIQKHDPGSYEDFIGEFGSDAFTRPETTYRAVTEEWRRVSLFFIETELKELQEIQ